MHVCLLLTKTFVKKNKTNLVVFLSNQKLGGN